MFNMVLISNKNNVVDVNGLFGTHFVNAMEKRYSPKALKYMFRAFSYRKMTFDEFFAMEVVRLLEDLIYNTKFTYGVNVRTIKNTIEKIKENTWLRLKNAPDTDRLDFDAIKGLMKFDILDHQKGWFEYYNNVPKKLKLRGALLHGSAGSGKTFMSLATAEMLHADRIVVACPNPAVDRVWVNSITKELYKRKQSYWASNSGKPYKGERIAIYHYEALNKALQDIDLLKANNVVLILDESHYLNEKNSKRTQLFYNLAMQLGTEDIILATGTPIKALGVELVPILRLLDPLFTKAVSNRFQKMFRGSTKYKLDLLKARLGLISLKIEKSELKLQEPITYKQKIKLKKGDYFTLKKIKERMEKFIKERSDYYAKNIDEMTAKFYNYLDNYKANLFGSELAEYNEYKRNLDKVIEGYYNGQLRFMADTMKKVNGYERKIADTLKGDDKKEFNNIKSVVKYLKLKIQGECLGTIVTGARIECHVEMAKAIKYKEIVDATLKKTVVFTNYINVANAAIERLEKDKYTPLSVYGNNTKQLSSTVKAFNEIDKFNPLVATYKSLSTAVPIIVADTLIIIDMPFRTYVYEQAISRLHRLGQDSQVKIFQIELDTGEEPNINTRGLDIITWSKEMVEAITGMELPYELDGKEISNETLSTESYDETDIGRDIKEYYRLFSKPNTKIEITLNEEKKSHLEW